MLSSECGELAASLPQGVTPPLRRQIARSRWWADALVIAWLLWLYDMVAGLAPLRQAAALAHASAVYGLERSIHLAPELAANQWLAARPTLGLILSDYYDNAHFIVTFALLGLLWWRRPAPYRPLRNALVLINLIGLAVFWRYPMAPPRMLVHAGFVDVVAVTHAIGGWHTGALASDADQLAAMPSLHMAWAAWCVPAVFALTSRRWMRALAIAHLALTGVAVIATGNHFLVDVAAGLATAAVALLAMRARAQIPYVTKLLRSRRIGTLPAGHRTGLEGGLPAAPEGLPGGVSPQSARELSPL